LLFFIVSNYIHEEHLVSTCTNRALHDNSLAYTDRTSLDEQLLVN